MQIFTVWVWRDIIIIIMIAPNSRARKGGGGKNRAEVKGEYGRISEEEEGNADYGGMVQPSQ